MRRALGLVGLGLLTLAVLVPAAGAAVSWTQAGADASRTSHVPVEGPDEPDRAFRVRVPGDLARGYFATESGNAPYAPGGPLLLDGVAYLPLRDVDGDGADGVVRVDLATAEVTPVVQLGEDRKIQRIGSDGERLFVVSAGDGTGDSFSPHVNAYDAEDGEELWNWATSVNTAVVLSYYWWCAQPAVADGTVFVSCTVYQSPSFTPFVVALDAETGEEKGYWSGEVDHLEGKPETRPRSTLVFGLSAAGENLYATAARGLASTRAGVCPQVCATPYRANLTLFAFSQEAENLRWAVGRDSQEVEIQVAGEKEQPVESQPGGSLHPAATSREVVVRWMDTVAALNPGQDGEVIWSETIGEGDTKTNLTLGSFALDEGSLYATSTQTVYGFDRDNPSDQWEMSLNPADQEVFDNAGALVLGEDTLYAVAHSNSGNGSSVYALDPGTGEVRWRHRLSPAPGADTGLHYHSLGDGFLSLVGTDGTFQVLGETPASIGPFPTADERYAEVGGEVTLDLSGTGPGALGPATRYRVHWGDGNATGWQESPVFRHAYGDQGDYDARVRAANGEDQTASTSLTVHVGTPAPAQAEHLLGDRNVTLDLSEQDFGELDEVTRYRVFWGDGNVSDWQEDPVFSHEYAEDGNVTARIQAANAGNETASRYVTMRVGQSPPPEPNLAQKAFAQENQDMTFGIIGVVLAVGGGAVGVTRRYRKRSRLQDELDAVERAYEETKGNPIECEAQLTERKTHARGLMLDGELDEQQFQVVETRVDELLQGLRKRSLEEEFDFLPYSLVKKGREMIEDGQVSALEAEAFLKAVDEDDVLSADQKAVVRERIEEWRGRDAGRGGAG